MLRFTIAVDPGAKTGFAVYDRIERRLVRLETMTFWTVYSEILAKYHEVFAVVVEVPNTKKNWHGPGAAHDVGRICQQSELLAEGLELAGLRVIRSHPQGKIKHAPFCKITGWTGSTNEHTRDAGMLAFGL